MSPLQDLDDCHSTDPVPRQQGLPAWWSTVNSCVTGCFCSAPRQSVVYALRQLSFIPRCALLFLVAFFFPAVLSQMQLSHKGQAGPQAVAWEASPDPRDVPVWLAC